MKSNIIFGGQGFIGQNLALALLALGERVLIIDKDHWKIGWAFPSLEVNDHCISLRANINEDSERILNVIKDFSNKSEHTTVWHLAANSDISAGNHNISVDLNDTFLTTTNILDICKKCNLKNLYFASSSAVYGNSIISDTGFTEKSPTQPISNYGAMKLASEAVLCSSNQQFLNQCVIFRFPNVIGYPATHGVIRDFILKLKNNKKQLNVLGNGTQNKPYLHVNDLVNAMLHLRARYTSPNFYEIVNIASTFCNVYVHEIAEIVKEYISPNAEIVYGTENFGWVGDMPQVNFDTAKLQSTGWQCSLSGLDAVELTIKENIERSFL